jgi:hypothetical protein
MQGFEIECSLEDNSGNRNLQLRAWSLGGACASFTIRGNREPSIVGPARWILKVALLSVLLSA